MTDRSGPSKEQAIVLKTIRHGETSRIATLFAPKWGKIAVLAKGARSGKSGAVGGALDAPSLIEAVIHIKSSRSVQLLGQTSTVDTFTNLKADVGKTAYSAVICEIMLKGFTDEEANLPAYATALQALRNINSSLIPNRYILLEFLLAIAESLGFGIDPLTCPVCGLSPGKTGLVNKFQLEDGAICCTSCISSDSEVQSISGESVGILRLLKRGNVNFERVKISRTAQHELTTLLMRHLRYHHQSFNHLPSYNMLGQLAPD